MDSRLTLLAASLFLVAAAHADGGGDYSVTTSLAQLETSTGKANQVVPEPANPDTESPLDKGNDSDDCN